MICKINSCFLIVNTAMIQKSLSYNLIKGFIIKMNIVLIKIVNTY